MTREERANLILNLALYAWTAALIGLVISGVADHAVWPLFPSVFFGGIMLGRSSFFSRS